MALTSNGRDTALSRPGSCRLFDAGGAVAALVLLARTAVARGVAAGAATGGRLAGRRLAGTGRRRRRRAGAAHRTRTARAARAVGTDAQRVAAAVHGSPGARRLLRPAGTGPGRPCPTAAARRGAPATGLAADSQRRRGFLVLDRDPAGSGRTVDRRRRVLQVARQPLAAQALGVDLDGLLV